MNRRAIDVKLFVQDVQEGAGHTSLMEKYDLTREQLDEALEILADAGKLPRSSLIPDTSQPSESAHPIASTCARCGALILADSGECPECLQNEVARLIDKKEEVVRASEEEPRSEPEEKVTTLEFEVAELEGPQGKEAAIHKPESRPKRRWLPAAAGISFVAVLIAAAFFYAGIPDFLTELWPTRPEKPWPAPAQKSAPKVASAPKPSEPLVIPPTPEGGNALSNGEITGETSASPAKDSICGSQLGFPVGEAELRAAYKVFGEGSGEDLFTKRSSPQSPEGGTDAPPEPQHASVAPQELPQIETPDKTEDASTKPDQINSALVKAVKEGSLDRAGSLIDRGGDVNAEDEQGSSLLLLAAKLGNEKLVDFLIKRGADRNRTDKDGFTPLGRACEAANEKVAELLLTGDESKGAATLFEACEKGRTQWVKLLVEHGADMNARNQQGATPLMVAAGNGHEPLVEWLLSNGADTRALDNKGYTALAWAYSPTAMNVTPFPVQRKIIRLLKHHSPTAVSSPGGGN